MNEFFYYPKRLTVHYILRCIEKEGYGTKVKFNKKDFMEVSICELYFDTFNYTGTTVNTARARLKTKNKKTWVHDVCLEDVSTMQKLQTNIILE